MRYILALLVAASVSAAALAIAEPGQVRAKSYDGDVKACNGKEVYLKPAEKKTLQLHNKARVSRDKPRLCIQQRLQKAARGHSSDMIQKETLSHDSKDGTTFDQRIKRAGYTSKDMSVYRIGENIGGGSGSQGSPRTMHKAWMDSDGHRENLLKPGFRQVGIGVSPGEYKGNDNHNMYTVDFGFRRK